MSISRRVSVRIAKRFGMVALVAPLVLAACADGGDEFSEALKDAEIAAGRNSAHALGVFHFKSGNYGLAIQHFQSATSRRPRSIEAWNGLAASYDKLGRFDLAERFYRRALVVEPQSAQTLNNLGYSYWLQGRYDIALAYLKDADGVDGGNRVIEANRQLAGSALRAELSKPESRVSAQSPTAFDETPASEEGAQGPQITVARSGVYDLITQPEPAPEVPPEIEPSPLQKQKVVPTTLGAPQVATTPAAPESLQDVTPTGQNRLSPSLAAPSLVEARLGWLDSDYDWSSHPSELGIRLPELSRLQNLAQAENRQLPRDDDVRVDLASDDTLVGPDFESTGSRHQVASAAPSLPVIELSNGAGRDGMAARLKGFLNRRGLPVARLTNVEAFDRERTTIYYRPGWEPYAMGLAGLLPTDVVLQPSDAATGDRPSVDIRIELGGDMLNFDRALLAERDAPDDISG